MNACLFFLKGRRFFLGQHYSSPSIFLLFQEVTRKPFFSCDDGELFFCSKPIEKPHPLIYNTRKTNEGEGYEIDIGIRLI